MSVAGASGAAGSPTSNLDLTDGYWLMTSTDTSGAIWTKSIITFSSSTPNPAGGVSLVGGIDWFETSPSFGIMFGGEEYDAGSFDPTTARLSFDQTGGWASSTLDHYEAIYSAASDTLAGSWNTGTPGVFTATRILSGHLLATPSVAASSQATAQLSSAKMVDGDMTTFWGTPNGKSVGESITLTLVAPSRIRGLRLLIWNNGSSYGTPSLLHITCRDSGGTVVDTRDCEVPTDVGWQPVALQIDSLVAELQLIISETNPPSSNRVSLNEIELFGLP